MAFTKVKKDPQAVLDYIVDFAAKLNARGNSDYLQTTVGETIVSATVTSSKPLELVVVSSALVDTDTAVLFWLSGGVANKEYTVTVHITTSLGRQDDRSVKVQMVEK